MEIVILYLHKALGYLETIQISDVIDIAIITYLIYRLLRLARGSRTGQVLKGVALLIAVLCAASLFHLHVLNYLLGSAMELGLLAIIIVFQPEIRHFLEQVGSSGFSTVFNHESHIGELEAAIDQTVEAYAAMSKSKTGALTVFERGSLLDDCIKAGTALDASVSSELLKNIFFENAPLHDGAVIIRNGRIAGAGCVLPLSSNTSISRELGMRHRAGIGTTEHTDAVVVICSEETGSISVAVNGTLRRHLAPETLRRTLRKELLPGDHLEEEEPGRLNLNALVGLLRGTKEDSDHVE